MNHGNALVPILAHNDANAMTRAVTRSARRPRQRAIVGGESASPCNAQSECRFQTRCVAATERCSTEEPRLQEISAGHAVACFFPRS